VVILTSSASLLDQARARDWDTEVDTLALLKMTPFSISVPTVIVVVSVMVRDDVTRFT
jgi:hypothetical protein